MSSSNPNFISPLETIAALDVSDPLAGRVVIAPTGTAVSGVVGLAQATGDEIGYLVDAKGYKISAINPKEHVTIAFGCSGE